jgi:hypothetical protein
LIQAAVTVAIVILVDVIATAIVIQAVTIVIKATDGFPDWAMYFFFKLQSANT